MPSKELFSESPQDYKDTVIPPEVKNRIIVEAGISMGWEGYAGEKGIIIGIDKYGSSAPGGKVMAEYGFTVENIFEKAKGLMKR